MPRAVAVALAGAVLFAACGGSAPIGSAPVCARVLKLGESGREVARADVADPKRFDDELQHAIGDYVRAANGLRSVLPDRLRGDVDLMVAAAKQHRFADADAPRGRVDAYVRSVCGGASTGA